MTDVCTDCNHALDLHSRDFRFRLPDELSDWSEDRIADETSSNGVFMRVAPDLFFVRSILPIKLRGSHEVACGVWLTIAASVVHQIAPDWDGPDYRSVTFSARLANELPPWPDRFLGSEVTTEVRHTDEIPYIVRSEDPELQAVLDDNWEHTLILDAFT